MPEAITEESPLSRPIAAIVAGLDVPNYLCSASAHRTASAKAYPSTLAIVNEIGLAAVTAIPAEHKPPIA